LGIDAEILPIRAVTITDNSIDDAQTVLMTQKCVIKPLPTEELTRLFHLEKMHCFKLLDKRVKARTFERQNMELHIRVAILNRFTSLGNPVTI
jgi:hypothetical protein